jgi:membrane protein
MIDMENLAATATRSAPGKRRFGRVLRMAVQRFADQDMSTYSSALAFQAFFSIFPFLLFLIAMLAFLDVPQFFDWLTQQAGLFVPQQALQQVTRVIDQIRTPNSTLLSVGVLAAWWAASAGVREAMTALTVSDGLPETRAIWLRVLLSLVYTVLLAVLMIAAALLFTVGPQAANWLAAQFGQGKLLALLWSWLRLPMWLAVLALTVTLIYHLAPPRRHPLKTLLPGALLSVGTWILASLAFSWYLSNFANYSALYGSIGTIIGVLLYFFISCAVLLFGAEVNAVMRHGAAPGASAAQPEMAATPRTLHGNSP